MYYSIKSSILFLVALVLIGCNRHTSAWEKMDVAEGVMESRPDSALTILDQLQPNSFGGEEEAARYALLKSIALDKNYIDTTSFDVIQPAIDYYLKNGTPDEKLRTYYYQGVIFLNRGDRNNAFYSFINGMDNIAGCTDSLCIARTLVAQAGLYKEFYDYDSYFKFYLKAADIYKMLSYTEYEFDCYINVLNGVVLLGNKSLSDSIINILNKIEPLDQTQKYELNRYKLSYALTFGNQNIIKELIPEQERNLSSQDDILNLARAYNKVGNNKEARHILDYIKMSNQPYDTLKYLSISVAVYEENNNYKEALALYKNFSHKHDSINLIKFEQKAQNVEEKHELELRSRNDAEIKSKIIWACLCGIILLSMCIIILILYVRSNKAKNYIAIQNARNAELENKRLNSERERLTFENKNLQLERDKNALEAENLAYRIAMLERESDSLKALLETPEDIPLEALSAIKVRIKMLNSLLAGYITSNDQYQKSYDTWVKELTENTDEFMNSNRLAFQISHPRFIKYFEDRNLSVDEINYVCLYAIGLHGKEVGAYIKKRGHVNLSSAIRKKLGIDKYETNIGIYVRKLLNNL